MTAEANKRLFKDTDGPAPLFNLVDEGTRPDSDISTKQLRKQVFDDDGQAWRSPVSRGRSRWRASSRWFQRIRRASPTAYGC